MSNIPALGSLVRVINPNSSHHRALARVSAHVGTVSGTSVKVTYTQGPDVGWTGLHLAHELSVELTPAWADALDDTQRATLTADLAAEELCACGHRDDCHDADSVCLHNEYADMSHVCYAYAPVQR